MNEENFLQLANNAHTENICAVFAAALCVGLLAIGTGSLGALWGLLILPNLNLIKVPTDK
jgi:hypothetical protein